jgi:hypothetical protein
MCELGNGEGPQAMKRKRQRLGSYGAGTLWGVKDDVSLTVVFKDTPIAKRRMHPTTPGQREWIALHSDWAVTNVGRGEIWVQHNGGDGVIISLFGAAI